MLSAQAQATLRHLVAASDHTTVGTHLALLTAALRDGIPAAYARLAADLAGVRRTRVLTDWLGLAADSPASKAYLTEHAAELRDPLAVADLASECRRQPSEAELWRHLGLLLLADQASDGYATTSPADITARATAALESDDLNRAYAWSCLARAAAPVTGALLMARVHLRRVDLSEAAEALEAAADRADPGEFSDILAAYDQLLAADPGQPWWHAQHADALRRAGQDDAAVAAWDRAIALAPDDPSLHFNRGHLLFGLSRYTEAESELLAVTRLRPGDVLSPAILLAAITWPDIDQATPYFRSALTSPGDKLNSLTRAFYQSIALAGLGRPDNAITQLRTAIEASADADFDDTDKRLLDRFTNPDLPGIDSLRQLLQTPLDGPKGE